MKKPASCLKRCSSYFNKGGTMGAGRKKSAVSDEEIIAALLSSGSLNEAAKATGLAPRTLYDRMGQREFQAAYSAAKADIIRQAAFAMNRNISKAVDAITEIMTNSDNSAATRLQAAKLILESAGKLSDRIEIEDRSTVDNTRETTFFSF